jgi:hypothetical protein
VVYLEESIGGNQMKRLIAVLVVVMLLAGLNTSVASADRNWYKLIAGQTMYVGNVRVFIDANGALHVVYVAAKGYCLNEIHAHAAYTLDGIPQENGNPVPGQFYYQDDDLNCAYRAEAVIPGDWSASPEAPIYIAAHAVVGMIDDPLWEETGWTLWCGAGNLDVYPFPGDNWAVFIFYTGVFPPGVPEL